MKIVFFNNCWPTNMQPNIGTYAKTMVEELIEAGAEVDVCAMQRTSNKYLDYIRFYWLLFQKPLPHDAFLYINHYTFLFPLMLRLLFIRRKCIYHWHGEELVVRSKIIYLLRWLMRRTFTSYDIHISPSQYYSQVINRILNIPYPQILVSPSGGIDLNLFTPGSSQRKSVEEFIIGYSSALTKSKGAELLLQLMMRGDFVKKISLPKIIFQVINYGEEAEFYISQYKNCGVELRVWNKCPKEQMPNFYRSIDLLLMPSIRESLGLVVLEAIACGVPAITFDICAFPEFIISRKSGERVPLSENLEKDTLNFLMAIEDVLEHYNEYHPRKIAEMYGRERVVALYREMLQSI